MKSNARTVIGADLLAGVIFIVAGCVAWISLADLPFGTAARMGPGFFPKSTATLILMIGLYLAGRAVIVGDQLRIESIQLRPFLLVFAAPVIFALIISDAGLVLAVLVMTLIAGLAAPDMKWMVIAISAPLLALIAALVFVKGLGTLIPLWPV
jgi:hypothetical protein